jgi:molybdopterin biosynthesis enzyme
VDTNAAYLSAELLSIGVPVVSSYAVRDEIDAIVRGLSLASADADVVLATGGLGLTDDDLTRQALAKFLGVEVIVIGGVTFGHLDHAGFIFNFFLKIFNLLCNIMETKQVDILL